MKKGTCALLTLFLLLALSQSAGSVPRHQANIVGSNYYRSREIERISLISYNYNFTLNMRGSLEPPDPLFERRGPSAPVIGLRADTPPRMDRYIHFSVTMDRSRRVWINGMEISPLSRMKGEPPGDVHLSWKLPINPKAMSTPCNADEAKRKDDTYISTGWYHHVCLSHPGWGDSSLLDAVAHRFDRIDADDDNVTSDIYTSATETDRTSSFYATPEPGTLSLLGIGLLGMIPILRARRK